MRNVGECLQNTSNGVLFIWGAMPGTAHGFFLYLCSGITFGGVLGSQLGANDGTWVYMCKANTLPILLLGL